jgi:hypothetical protein
MKPWKYHGYILVVTSILAGSRSGMSRQHGYTRHGGNYTPALATVVAAIPSKSPAQTAEGEKPIVTRLDQDIGKGELPTYKGMKEALPAVPAAANSNITSITSINTTDSRGANEMEVDGISWTMLQIMAESIRVAGLVLVLGSLNRRRSNALFHFTRHLEISNSCVVCANGRCPTDSLQLPTPPPSRPPTTSIPQPSSSTTVSPGATADSG